MFSTFKIISGNINVEVDVFGFNGGELNIRLPLELLNNIYATNNISVEARISDSEGVMALAMIKDALDRIAEGRDITLYMGYVPYARQDRVCNLGEALSIKVFCNMINAMGFHRVITLDNHSDVATALLNNVLNIPPESVISKSRRGLAGKITRGELTLVAPDAGATKKVDKVATFFGSPKEVIQGIKKRDVSTGKLSGFSYIGSVQGKDLLIVDDICDGGGTFLGLTAILKEFGAKSVSLYVSHGIFSNGLLQLQAELDNIYTSSSLNFYPNTTMQVEVINWL